MSHANALLAPKGRLALAQCVVEDGWSLRRAAERFQTTPQTAKRWADRYRARDQSRPAVEAMADRSSRPSRSPKLTPRPTVRKIVHLRNSRGWGPARIAHKLGMHPSTVNAVRVREGLPRLNDVDLATRRAVRAQVIRYERDAPGDLVHVDIKKLGKIPDGGGHHSHGRAAGRRNSRAHSPARHNGQVRIGYGYVHTAIDDRSRLAYSEIHANEKAATATGFWRRAVAWFAAAGVKIRRVITDNGACYRSRLWKTTCAQLGITAKYTRPYRPQTNGKVERFHRTLLVEWAYVRPYPSEAARAKALTKFIHLYNHHRTHTALAGATPASRVTNLSGQNN